MDSTLIKYRAFLVAARLGSFTKAGEALGYSQSGISRMIADLEQRTGIKNIVKVEIGHIDLLRDATFVKVFYKAPKDEVDTIGNNPKPFKL